MVFLHSLHHRPERETNDGRGGVDRNCAAAAASLPACTLFPVKENEEGAMDALDIPRVLQKKHTALLAGCGVTATKKTAAKKTAVKKTATKKTAKKK